MADVFSRRATLVGGLTIAGADLAPFVRRAKAADATEAAGPIQIAYSEFITLAQAHDAACEETWAAEERFIEPERPAWHPVHSEGGYKLVRLGNGKCRSFLCDRDDNLAYLRELAAKSPDPEDEHFTWHAGRSRRAKETLAKIGAWKAECGRRADAAGLPAANEAEARARAAAAAKARALLAMEPATLTEACYQAAIVYGGSYGEAGDSDRLLQSMMRLAGIQLYWLAET